MFELWLAKQTTTSKPQAYTKSAKSALRNAVPSADSNAPPALLLPPGHLLAGPEVGAAYLLIELEAPKAYLHEAEAAGLDRHQKQIALLQWLSR